MREVPRTNMEASHYEVLFIGLIFCKDGAAQRRGARPATNPKFARGRGIEPGKEKGRALRKPSLVGADLSTQETPGDIPTPPRATIKLFDATLCITLAGPWRKTGENWSARTLIGAARSGNRIVNLTLTAEKQSPARAVPAIRSRIRRHPALP